MINYSNVCSKAAKVILSCYFLSSHDIVVGLDSVMYYPVSGVLTQTALSSLISIAEKFKLHYYVCEEFNCLCFCMYIPKKLSI